MKARSVYEYTMFTNAQLLCNWHEQRPSNQDDFDFSVMGWLGRVLQGSKLLLNLLLGYILNGTPYRKNPQGNWYFVSL
jgi:hypothetical protein